jgi:4-amino-4-deoxy-L-arabinose transferase-like glycosyltransferase
LEPIKKLQTATDLNSSVETSSTNLPQVAKRRFKVRWDVVAILLVILLIAGIRWRLRDFPLERDEGEYAYAGQLILEGIPPYALAYNMKLPGTYAAYALVMAVFGQTPAGIHLGLIVINAVSILLVFGITKRLFDPVAAVVAGASFGLFTIRPLVLGLAAHATHFVALFALLGIYILLKNLGTNRNALFFASGFCFGLAFLMKQPGIFFGIFGGLYLCWSEWPAADQRAAFVHKVVAFSAGVLLPYALTCVILLRAGVFQKFWFWTVSYARAYGSELTLWQGLHQLANRVELQKEHIHVIYFLVVFGLASFLWNYKIRPYALFAIGLLGFSFLAISVGLYFRGHYFVMLYPALALLTGVGVSSMIALLRRLRIGWVATWAPAVLFVLAFANAVYAERMTFFVYSPREACRYVYGPGSFSIAVQVAAYIRAHSSPDARVAVVGSEPEIYFYADRKSATGYIYTYALVEEQPYSSVMQNEMIREVESVRPEFIVYVFMRDSWDKRSGADTHIFDWADAYVKKYYTLDGIADGGNHDVFRWGSDSWNYRPRRPEFLAVFRRN